MRLGRGFHSLVDGCKSKPDRLLTVIEEVGSYMRLLFAYIHDF